MQTDVGPEYKTGNMAEAEGEPGAVENRLTLSTSDPRFKDKLEAWEDGGEYPIKSGTIRQISPGEFEIIKLDLGGSSERTSDKGEGEPMQSGEDGTRKQSMYRNPAIENL